MDFHRKYLNSCFYGTWICREFVLVQENTKKIKRKKSLDKYYEKSMFFIVLILDFKKMKEMNPKNHEL